MSIILLGGVLLARLLNNLKSWEEDIMGEENRKKRGRPSTVTVVPYDFRLASAKLGTFSEHFCWFAAQAAAALQAELLGLENVSFGTAGKNLKFANQLMTVLDRLGYAIECPRCGEPSRLRCFNAPGSTAGQFQLRHCGRGGVPHYARNVLPRLRLIRRPQNTDGDSDKE